MIDWIKGYYLHFYLPTYELQFILIFLNLLFHDENAKIRMKDFINTQRSVQLLMLYRTSTNAQFLSSRIFRTNEKLLKTLKKITGSNIL